ncbi:Putative enoyl-CoA hydratase/isomerase [Mycobacteroides abscessus subsp. abscessus]|nr:Putative enoyl-CoA hydratase/isomerase [Mycobacteroides abscessus subsp. abscessus]
MAAAEQLAAGPPTNTLDAQLDLEQTSIAEASVSPTGIEGVDAFVGKRKPVWP